MDFYTVLPSNASPHIYPDNKTSHFKIQLAERLELHGDWQVALLELNYPNTLTHVQPEHNWIKIMTPKKPRIETARAAPGLLVWQYEVQDPPHERTLSVKPGHYPTADTFLLALKKALEPVEAIPDAKNINSVVEIVQNNFIFFHPFVNYTDKSFPFSSDSTYEFSPVLARQMGLPHAGPYRANTETKGVRPIDLSLGFPSQMFVYMDTVKEQIVGHTRAPLIRSVPTNVEAKFGSMTSYKCEQPIYFDLNTKSFDTVKIDIRTDTGAFMPFEDGTLTLLCHFKRRA